MKQTRLSIGCQDWQKTVRTLGAVPAGILLYLRILMRSMQSPEIQITVPELARETGVPEFAAESALRAIVAAGYLEREDAPDGIITLRDRKEAAAQAEMFRKRAARLLSRQAGQSGEADSPRGQSGRAYPAPIKSAAPRADGPSGQSGVLSGTSPDLSVKQYETDFFMIYDGRSEEKEKAPHTPQKEKSLTEQSGRAHASTPAREPELPADQLEAEYIDVAGSWQPSLRQAVRAESEETREAFYLFCRLKAESGERMSGDRVRAAWLAARRIPAERRADSILAAALGGWKTIRDCGSGCYFEKETGRVVSLVRGPVQYAASTEQKANEDLAIRLARNMRRS